MAIDDEAPAVSAAGAHQENLGDQFGSQYGVTAPSSEGADNEDADVEAAFKEQSDLILRIQTHGGDLIAAGAFEAPTVQALAKTFGHRSDVEETFTIRARKAGAGSDALQSLAAAIRRVQAGRVLRLIPAEEVITMPPPQYLIDGMVPEQAAAVLYGPSGLGKTFVTLDWAACIASGVPWLGHGVMKGPVIYVAAEGIGGLNKRLSAWKQARGVDVLTDLFVLPDAVNLMDKAMVAEVIKLAAAVEPSLIVFDTHARCMVGGDESSAKDTGLVIAQLARVQVETGAGTLSVHHTDKKGTTERGSGALRGAVDTMIEMTKMKSGALTLTCDKQRNFEPFDPIPLAMASVGDSLVPTLASGGPRAGTLPPSPYRAAIEEVLRKARQSGTTPMSQNAVLDAVAGNAAKVTATLQQMANDPDCFVVVEKKGRSYQYDWTPQ